MTSDTTNFSFTLPSADEQPWATTMNDGIQEIDTLLAVSLDTDGTLKAGAVDEATVVATGILTHTQMVNRTRTLFVPGVSAYDTTNLGAETEVTRGASYGWPLTTGTERSVVGNFFTPSDYVSGMTIVAVVQAGATGNLYGLNTAYIGAAGEAYDTHTDVSAGAVAAIAVTADDLAEIASITASDVAAGDYVSLKFLRDDHISDTAGTSYFLGWKVSYTADM